MPTVPPFSSENILRKLIGWLIFLFGLSIILTSLYFSFKIFTGGTPPPQIFTETKETEEKSFPALPQQIQSIIQEQLKNFIPKENINKLLNLISFSLFAGIMILGGSVVSNLGIRLLKD